MNIKLYIKGSNQRVELNLNTLESYRSVISLNDLIRSHRFALYPFTFFSILGKWWKARIFSNYAQRFPWVLALMMLNRAHTVYGVWDTTFSTSSDCMKIRIFKWFFSEAEKSNSLLRNWMIQLINTNLHGDRPFYTANRSEKIITRCDNRHIRNRFSSNYILLQGKSKLL